MEDGENISSETRPHKNTQGIYTPTLAMALINIIPGWTLMRVYTKPQQVSYYLPYVWRLLMTGSRRRCQE